LDTLAVHLAKTAHLRNDDTAKKRDSKMGWLDWLKGDKRAIQPIESRSASLPTSIQQQRRDDLNAAHDDLITGWQLVVTMSSTTPLEWLLRDGETTEKPQDVPQLHGAWVPKLRTFRELGFDIDEVPDSTRASEIGQIPEDGGDFLPFLILYRKLVEAKEERQIILDNLNDLGAQHPEIVSKLGGDLSKSFVVRELLTLSGCGATTAERLYQAQYLSKEQVLQETVEGLTKVKGIGPNTARKILALQPKS